MKAVFLDKDGTIVDNSTYPPHIPKDNLLKEDILEGLRYLKTQGFKLIIISNQPWVSKGLLSQKEIHQISNSLISKLHRENIIIDDFYYCPHQTKDSCLCKKPSPQLILEGIKHHNIDLNQSYMIGDSEKDMLAGKKAGIKTILVLTGHGEKHKHTKAADFVIKNINSIQEVVKDRSET